MDVGIGVFILFRVGTVDDFSLGIRRGIQKKIYFYRDCYGFRDCSERAERVRYRYEQKLLFPVDYSLFSQRVRSKINKKKTPEHANT